MFGRNCNFFIEFSERNYGFCVFWSAFRKNHDFLEFLNIIGVMFRIAFKNTREDKKGNVQKLLCSLIFEEF